MVASRKASEPHANRLLGLLPHKDYERLRPHLHHIPLEYKKSLYRANKPIEFIYFICRLPSEHHGKRRRGRGRNDRQ
jgi:hypothetical protein